MEFLRRLPLPRRLSARLWLVSIPSALLSFERRQHLPRLPIGRWRFLGLPLIGAGALLALWSWHRQGTSHEFVEGDPPELVEGAYSPGPARLSRKPGTLGGLLVLAGAALFLRSLLLAAYSLLLASAAASDAVTVEEPRPDLVLGRGPPYV